MVAFYMLRLSVQDQVPIFLNVFVGKRNC